MSSFNTILMNDADVLKLLKKKVGAEVHFKLEDDRCVELDLTSKSCIHHGLVRHHSTSEKEEIVSLIARLRNLRFLDLRRNMLFSLPESFGDLTYLTYLDLGSNWLGKVPAWLSKLRRLEYLNLGVNKLDEVPAAISELANLKTLLVHKNNIARLPEEYAKLHKLEYLNLYLNRMRAIPKFVWGS
jgi:internalin A